MMKLEHANITVASIDEAVKLLGTAFPDCRLRGEGALNETYGGGRWVHFGNDDFYVALQENTRHRPRGDVPYRDDGINHIGFIVTGLDDLLARLYDAGYSLSPVSAMDTHPHRRRAYINDANGFEWEFVEYLSAETSERNDYSQ